MLLTQFIRDRSDVELERLAREDALWNSHMGTRPATTTYSDAPGCLLCNAFDLRSLREYQYLRASGKSVAVERVYMGLATRNGEAETGAMIARLARRELGRRAVEAIGELEQRETEPAA